MQRANVYIKIEEYKDTLDIITLIQNKVKQSRMILEKIHELKSREDNELMEWQHSLDDIEKRVEFMDTVLLEPDV